MFRLIRHFSVMSAIATGVITVALAADYSWIGTRDLYQYTQERNTGMARVLAADIWSTHADYINSIGDVSAHDLRHHPVTARLDREMRELTKGLSILKVKIFTPSGLTIYSSELSQIGNSKAQDPKFRRVVDELTTHNTMSFRRTFNGLAGVLSDRHIAESYVPIITGDNMVGAVVEIYGDVTEKVHQIKSEMRRVALFCGLALGVLYLLLLMIVRRADRIIKQQYRRLESFNSDLEEAVQQRTRRLVNQHSVLTWLARSDEFRQGSLDQVARNLNKSVASSLGVERSSLWLLNPDHTAITCIDLYEAVLGRHSCGAQLTVASFPAYFAALQRDEVICANDALTDSRTREFSEVYLKPLGIGSMLDAPIVQNGLVVGVLCCERVGEPIQWTPEQQLFAASISNLMALTLERLERRAAEESLKAANESVLAANEAKSLFLANMSHEIRTPMNGVFGMTDLLLRTELSDRQQRLAHTIQRSARSLLTIINDVLDVSRIEAGKLSLDVHDFDPRHAVEETIELLAEEADRKGIGLSFYVAPSVPPATVGDGGRLRQVATNLVSNAIKFTMAGEVAVRMESTVAPGGDGGDVASIELTVRDTGVGIPKDVQERLFQSFHQADTSITRRFGGTGLGLAISRHLVEMMGGSIRLESEMGIGTTVTVRVPLKVAAAEAMTGRRQSQCLGGKRILVLDERATNREIMLAYLKDAGACPTGVAHSDDALMLLRAAAREGEPFEAAVIDMVMPAASALEVGRRIKADPAIAETRLVMVTSLSWKGDANMVREGGFEAQLSKPVRGVELVGTIGRVIAAVAPMPAASKADPPAAPVSRRRLGARVLLAEDNPVNLEVAREFLANLGCSVSVAVNGMEAVRLHASQPFDLVLMDCQMPEMDGLTATRRIRLHEEARRLPSTPIIAVTANAFEEDRIACLAAGMDDYIRKPFVEETLEAAMLRWFDPRSTNTAVPAAAAAEPAAGVAAPPLAAPAAVLDEVMINRLRAAHRPLLGRLIETYLSYAPKAVAQLSALLLAADAKGLKTSAHSLKSSSANVGALALSAHCRELEGIAKAEAMPLDPRCEGLVRAIEAEFARVVAALEALRAELAVEPAAAASR